MRYIKIDKIQEDMVLAKTIYSSTGTILVKAGIVLKERFIKAIKALNVPGIYIDDEMSTDIQFEDLVDEELKLDTIAKIKTLFTGVLNNDDKRNLERNLESLKGAINTLANEVIDGRNQILNSIELRNADNYLYTHAFNVSILSMLIGSNIGLNDSQMVALGTGAMLADIGKLLVPQELIMKKGKLSDKEFEIVKQHTTLGYQFLRDKCGFNLDICAGAMFHHEKHGGGGYPNNKAGDNIPLFSKIISLADAYDGMVSQTVYHEPMTSMDAVKYIIANANTQFDPEMIKVFLKRVAVFPIGISVLLNNNYKGIVAENYEAAIMRPKIKIIVDGKSTGQFIDLARNPAAAKVNIVECNVDL